MRLVMIAPLFALAGLPAEPPQTGWQTLFDGSSLAQWRGYRQEHVPAESWQVTGGALRAVPGKPGDLVTRATYGDFELELEWRVTPGGNSGVFYRASEDGAAIYWGAPEMQVLDDARHPDGRNPKTSAGAFYAVVAPVGKTLKPVGQWNSARVVARGSRVEHWLNGRRVAAFDLDDAAVKAAIAGSKFAGYPGFAKARSGLIGLQNHGEEVWFRKIRVRRL